MTESDIYQVIGKAYCDGYSQGLDKRASLEKQALSPEMLLSALKGIAGKGNIARTANMLGRLRDRAWGAIDALERVNRPSVLNDVQRAFRKNLGSVWSNLTKETSHMNGILNVAISNPKLNAIARKAGEIAGSNAYTPYYNSAISKLLKL